MTTRRWLAAAALLALLVALMWRSKSEDETSAVAETKADAPDAKTVPPDPDYQLAVGEPAIKGAGKTSSQPPPSMARPSSSSCR